MTKTRLFVLIGLLLVIAAFALLLWGGTDTRFGNFIFGTAFAPVLLFFIFVAALGAVMKILVDAALPSRMSKVDPRGWERTRTRGKLSYVLNALLFCGLPIIVILAIQVAEKELTSYIVRNFVVLGIVLIAGVAAIAAALWEYQERTYLRAKEAESNSIGGPLGAGNAE